MTVRFDLLDTDKTFLRELTGCIEGTRMFNLGRNRKGHGYLAMPSGHADTAFLEPRRFVRCHVDGGSAVFTWMLQNSDEVRVGDDRVVQWDGDGGWVYLGSGDWGGAVVEGIGNSGWSTHGWVAADWDETGWTPSVGWGTVATPDIATSINPEFMASFPAPGAERVWDVALSANANGGVGHDTGSRYYRHLVGLSGYTGKAIVAFAVDDGATVWWNGVRKGRFFTAKITTHTFEVDLDGSDVQLAVKAYNGVLGDKPNNPGAFVWAVLSVDAEGEPAAVLAQSADGAGVWLDEAPQGVTWGYVAAAELTAAKDRGAIPEATTSVTGALDTDSQAWSTSLSVYRIKDGELLGDALASAAQAFNCDFKMLPDLEVAGYDSQGSDKTATVILTDYEDTSDPEPAAVAQATVKTEAVKGNTGRIASEEARAWYEPALGGEPRVELPLTIGSAADIEDALAMAPGAFADVLRERQQQPIQTPGPAGERPLVDYFEGDTIAVRSETAGAKVGWRVDAIALQELPGGDVDFDVDLLR